MPLSKSVFEAKLFIWYFHSVFSFGTKIRVLFAMRYFRLLIILMKRINKVSLNYCVRSEKVINKLNVNLV